jgi:hypothetical protein
MNISTGMHATREVQDYLLFAINEGEKKCRNFVKSALSVGQFVNLYSPISKSKLKTFEHMNAKTSLKCKYAEIITGHINPEIVFIRVFIYPCRRRLMCQQHNFVHLFDELFHCSAQI